MFRTKPTVPLCRKPCCHCGIFFLTHRRNTGRRNVGCPFGCREAHRKRESNRRSAAFYRKYPDKKRTLNQRRYRVSSSEPSPPTTDYHDTASVSTETSEAQQQGSESTTSNAVEHHQAPQCPPELVEVLPKAQDPQLMEHVRVIVSVIEGRQLSLGEIWQGLLHFWRQRGMDRRSKVDQIVSWLKANPP